MLDFSHSLKPDKSTSDKVGIRVKSFAILLLRNIAPWQNRASVQEIVCMFVYFRACFFLEN